MKGEAMPFSQRGFCGGVAQLSTLNQRVEVKND